MLLHDGNNGPLGNKAGAARSLLQIAQKHPQALHALIPHTSTHLPTVVQNTPIRTGCSASNKLR
ncbi:hypothetical protein [Candidatus Symbiobacter mobilis]|uniref:Uncharacterized protein n=1 Tax=Candidatus Symbiobacter mobilis CR TaxID=946483 RepID=U5N9R7_9BURK|nr:hypothetical protein [Candidatus Symbiobacter mobilis]AGX88311.1 hypothetical protein Cenrod_2246 [Candidatus Symbiobacter mobilis CR]